MMTLTIRMGGPCTLYLFPWLVPGLRMVRFLFTYVGEQTASNKGEGRPSALNLREPLGGFSGSRSTAPVPKQARLDTPLPEIPGFPGSTLEASAPVGTEPTGNNTKIAGDGMGRGTGADVPIGGPPTIKDCLA